MIPSPSTSSIPLTTLLNEQSEQSGILGVSASNENIETKSRCSSHSENQHIQNQQLLMLAQGDQKCGCLGWFKRKRNSGEIDIKADGLCFFRCVLLYETKDPDYARIYKGDTIKADFSSKYNKQLHGALNAALAGTHFNLFRKYYEDQNQLNPVFIIELYQLLLNNLHLIWDPHAVFNLAKKAVTQYEQALVPSEKTQLPVSYLFAGDDKKQASLFSSIFFSNLVGNFDPELFCLNNNHYSLSQKAEQVFKIT